MIGLYGFSSDFLNGTVLSSKSVGPNDDWKTSSLVVTHRFLVTPVSVCVNLLFNALFLMHLFTIKNLHVWLHEFSLVFLAFMLSVDTLWLQYYSYYTSQPLLGWWLREFLAIHLLDFLPNQELWGYSLFCPLTVLYFHYHFCHFFLTTSV